LCILYYETPLEPSFVEYGRPNSGAHLLMETLLNEVGDAVEQNVEISFRVLAAAIDVVRSSSGYIQKGI
jgi:hypothetical protein